MHLWCACVLIGLAQSLSIRATTLAERRHVSHSPQRFCNELVLLSGAHYSGMHCTTRSWQCPTRQGTYLKGADVAWQQQAHRPSEFTCVVGAGWTQGSVRSTRCRLVGQVVHGPPQAFARSEWGCLAGGAGLGFSLQMDPRAQQQQLPALPVVFGGWSVFRCKPRFYLSHGAA